MIGPESEIYGACPTEHREQNYINDKGIIFSGSLKEATVMREILPRILARDYPGTSVGIRRGIGRVSIHGIGPKGQAGIQIAERILQQGGYGNETRPILTSNRAVGE